MVALEVAVLCGGFVCFLHVWCGMWYVHVVYAEEEGVLRTLVRFFQWSQPLTIGIGGFVVVSAVHSETA